MIPDGSTEILAEMNNKSKVNVRGISTCILIVHKNIHHVLWSLTYIYIYICMYLKYMTMNHTKLRTEGI